MNHRARHNARPAESRQDRRRALWRTPRSFTSVVPLPGTDLDALHDRLRRLNDPMNEALADVADLHSFRLGAIPADPPKRHSISVLVNAVFDRPLDEHLPELTKRAGSLLATAFGGADFSGRPADVPELLLRHHVKENTLHLGSIGRTVEQILDEHRLKKAVHDYVEAEIAADTWSDDTEPESIRRQIRNHFLTAPPGTLRAAAKKLPRKARFFRFLDLAKSFIFFPPIGVLKPDIDEAIDLVPTLRGRIAYWTSYTLWWTYSAVPTGLGLLLFRLLEIFESDVIAPPPDESKLARLEAREDLRPKNEVTLWFPVRPTWVRRLALKVVLFGSEIGCRHFWTHGRLSGINTIHYARILQLDGGRSMVFMSDYDGGLNRYLDDFLGIGSRAVVPITSSLDGCPKTRWLFHKADRNTFGLRWRGLIRRYQLETSLWYSAYPELTVREILDNAALRDGLFAERLTDAQLRRWMRRL